MRVTAGTTLTLENSNFAANQNPIVVDSQASLVVKSSTFEGNAPNSAIVSSGSVSVSDSTFRNNIATSKGGAIRHTPKSGQGYLTLLNSLFDSNVADNDGGAVYVDAGFDPLIVENLVFSNNKAQRGGALYQAQSEHSSIGTNALAQIQLNGNEATLQGDNFATGLDHLEATPSRPLSLLSGATLADIEVRAVDKYNNTYFPPRTALPKLGLSLKNSGTLVGSIAKFALNGTVKFAQIQLYAPVGAQELLIAPAISTYDATRYQTKLNVKTLPCTQQGLEERVLVASPHPACLKAVCSNGCLSDYGYCRNNFCHCTAPDREGINCGLKKGNRDVLTLTLPNSWTPTAENRDNLLDTIQEKLSTNATVEFRSFETSASAGSLFRRADPVTIFRVALKSPSGQYIEQAALTTFSGVVSTALAPVVGEPVVVETKESPKGRVTGSGFVPILIMVLTGIAMLISITFAGFLTIYRDTRSVKASSLVFSQLIIFGTILGYSLIFLYVGTPSSALCVSQVWVGGVAYTLAVGNLVGKTWRIYKIFTTRGKARPMKDIHVLMLTLGMLAVELTLDALWTGLAPLEPTLKETDGSRFWVCDSPNAANRPLTFLNLAWKAILLLTACVLAFLTRNVDVMYGESKAIGASSYVMLLAGAIVVPVVFLPQTESQTAFYLKAAGILLSGVVTNICLFWPKLYSAMVIESGNDSFLRTFTRRTSRRMGSSTAGKVSSGKGSSSSEEPSVAQAQRSPQEAAQDLAIVQAPAQCSVYMKGAIAGKYTPCSIVTDTQAGIILISPSNTKNEKVSTLFVHSKCRSQCAHSFLCFRSSW
ncbi:7 transmembrane sweet-taste receptor of 3 GCPR-domain-containing protein [Gaertneriomyces semiglobifer]|nr:7 transmembrane sweet-taste receptor of 3 GCPR-domain-containing protein [Gaertneriomyces semiglobifer]